MLKHAALCGIMQAALRSAVKHGCICLGRTLTDRARRHYRHHYLPPPLCIFFHFPLLKIVGDIPTEKNAHELNLTDTPNAREC